MDGTYLVPNEIVEKFKDIAGGGRAEVLQLFRKHNGDKDMFIGLQNLYGMSSYGVHYSWYLVLFAFIYNRDFNLLKYILRQVYPLIMQYMHFHMMYEYHMIDVKRKHTHVNPRTAATVMFANVIKESSSACSFSQVTIETGETDDTEDKIIIVCTVFFLNKHACIKHANIQSANYLADSLCCIYENLFLNLCIILLHIYACALRPWMGPVSTAVGAGCFHQILPQEGGAD